MKQRRNRHTVNMLVLVLLLSILGVFALGGRKNLQDYLKLETVHRSLLDENMRLIDDNKRLKAEKENLYDPTYLEKLARESLGLVKADETIYVVEDMKDNSKQ